MPEEIIWFGDEPKFAFLLEHARKDNLKFFASDVFSGYLDAWEACLENGDAAGSACAFIDSIAREDGFDIAEADPWDVVLLGITSKLSQVMGHNTMIDAELDNGLSEAVGDLYSESSGPGLVRFYQLGKAIFGRTVINLQLAGVFTRNGNSQKINRYFQLFDQNEAITDADRTAATQDKQLAFLLQRLEVPDVEGPVILVDINNRYCPWQKFCAMFGGAVPANLWSWAWVLSSAAVLSFLLFWVTRPTEHYQQFQNRHLEKANDQVGIEVLTDLLTKPNQQTTTSNKSKK